MPYLVAANRASHGSASGDDPEQPRYASPRRCTTTRNVLPRIIHGRIATERFPQCGHEDPVDLVPMFTFLIPQRRLAATSGRTPGFLASSEAVAALACHQDRWIGR